VEFIVTGAAGFIGSHVVDRLLRDGHTVVGVDNFDPFYDAGTKWVNVSPHLSCERYSLVRADIRDLEGLRHRLPDGCDVIVHLAARAGVRPSIADPIGYQETNVRGTHNLLEFARERGIRQFVFASSSSVYGVNPNVPWSEEDTGLLPISPYASTKVSGELLGHVYARLFGIRFLALRFFTVYGPRQRPDLAIRSFATRMLAGETLPVFGSGDTRRDYTYIADVVDGVLAAVRYEDSLFEVINLGNNRHVSLREMIASLEEVLGVRARVKHLPEQPGDVPQTWASIEKARRLLGYEPGTSFREGLEHFGEWLRSPAARPLVPLAG
jgi:UDP-glucuronate 4-epimerase